MKPVYTKDPLKARVIDEDVRNFWKAYYENAAAPKKAIYEMLHIKNHKQFYLQSKIEEKMKRSASPGGN